MCGGALGGMWPCGVMNSRPSADEWWRLSFLADAGRRQAKSAAVDLVGHGAFVNRFSNSLIKPPQEFGKGLIGPAHETHQQSLMVDGDRKSVV